MKKILLVTLQGDNLGNRLQNYALQETLKKLNYEVYTPYTEIIEFNSTKKRIKNYIKYILACLNIEKYKPIRIRLGRIKRFKQFDNQYIDNRIKTNYKEAFKQDWNKYDYAITGSDQVWHKWTDDLYELPFYYLEFVPKEKRTSYAASFGFDKFNDRDKETHIKGLLEMCSISVREESGAKLIKNTINKDVPVVLDPTLLLSKNEWMKIAKEPIEAPKEKYILVYMLGEITKEYRKKLELLSKERNLKIINIFNQDDYKHYLTTPDEFIWYVNNAEIIFTDSFHACVFSIIFHKNFIPLHRVQEGFKDMFGRIETLLSICGLNEKDLSSSNIKIEWTPIDKRLNKRIDESKRYLDHALND